MNGSTKKREIEKRRLHKIINSSKRAKKVREAMGLNKDEYLIDSTHAANSVIWQIGSKKNSKVRFVKNEFNGQNLNDLELWVMDYIKKEIIDHFKINLEYHLVSRCIYGDFIPISTFEFYPYMNRKNGKPEIQIVINEVLNRDSLRYLYKKIEDYNSLISGFFKTKNTKGLNCRDMERERERPMDFFDEKYELSIEYQLLKEKYPKRIKKSELDNLVKKAQKILGNKPETAYNAKSLRKDIEQFHKYFDL